MTTDPIKSSSLKRSLPTPFLIKTYQLVDDPAVDDIISWNDNGCTSIVWQPVDFCRDLLPKFFKHNNLPSFVRQLNTYGFRKVVSSRWEFANDNFKRGKKHLLSEIHRGKHLSPLELTVDRNNNSLISQGNSPVFSTSLLPTNHSTKHRVKKTEDIVAENDRLRKENTHLNQELSQMINMCNNIRMMTSNYVKPQKETHQRDQRDRNSPVALMAMKSTSSNETISKDTLLSLKVKEKAGHDAEENPKKFNAVRSLLRIKAT